MTFKLPTFLFLLLSFVISLFDYTQFTETQVNQKGLLFQKEVPIYQIDSFIRASQQTYNIPAVSLALVKDGKVLYYKNYGVKNSTTRVPINENAVFEAASITKPVFAYLVCRLAQKGVIDLDEPLHKRFPFPELERYACYKDMTARHILTHVSGLPNWGVEMLACPGEEFGYSGQGFEYLTKALTQSYTRSMDRKMKKYLREEVTIPLNMSNTHFTRNRRLKKLCVDGHINGGPTKHTFDNTHEMAGGMYSTSEDIAKFAIALLNRKGLNQEIAESMFTISTPVPKDQKEFDSGYDQGYGLGIYIRDSPFGKVFGHSGSNGDFECLFEVYDDLKMGFVLLTNSDTGDKLTIQMAKYLIEG